MKYAYYGVAMNEEEKVSQIREIKERTDGDKDFYSAYIDVAPRYDGGHYKRSSMNSLKAAVRKKKIQVVVIKSLNDLYMEEEDAYLFLRSLMNSGVQVAVNNPNNIKTKKEIMEMVYDEKMDYMMNEFSLPLIAMGECYVQTDYAIPLLYLEKDFAVVERKVKDYTKMYLCDAVKTYRERGFFLYRAEVNGWYRVQGYMVNVMKDVFDMSYQIMMDSILEDNMMEENMSEEKNEDVFSHFEEQEYKRRFNVVTLGDFKCGKSDFKTAGILPEDK